MKGETENALLRLPFKGAYMFRPGAIQPLHGIRSKTKLALGPLLSFAVTAFPKYVTTTEQIGRAMIQVARQGSVKHVLENEDINAILSNASPASVVDVLITFCGLPGQDRWVWYSQAEMRPLR